MSSHDLCPVVAVITIHNASPNTGAGLDNDLVSGGHQSLHTERGHAHTILILLYFLGHTDYHGDTPVGSTQNVIRNA